MDLAPAARELTAVRYVGRIFSATDIAIIRTIIADRERYPNRKRISVAVCEALAWHRPDGRLKDMSCRVALLRMHDDGLIELPPPTQTHSFQAQAVSATVRTDPGSHRGGSRRDLGTLTLWPTDAREDKQLWREYITRYHYLGYSPLPGAQIRYLVRTADGQCLAALGFGAAAWQIAPRDTFIGWTAAQRQTNLRLVLNNARFLILPWVQVHNLASSILAQATRQIGDDFLRRYAYRPVLLETFVETDRFRGTSYQAANWRNVGKTAGRGKMDRYKRRALPVKDIYLYPLTSTFRQALTRFDP